MYEESSGSVGPAHLGFSLLRRCFTPFNGLTLLASRSHLRAMAYVTAPQLETGRLRLRAYQIEDFDGFAAFYASDRSRHADGPVSRETAWQLFAAGAGRWALVGYGAWAVERREESGCIGVVSLNHPIAVNQEPELGWLFWAPFEGQGYAQEAARKARRYAFDVLGWRTMVSYISAENSRSIRLAARLGAELDRDATEHADGDTCVYRHNYYFHERGSSAR